MKTEDIIAHLFCPIDDRMKHVPKHPQAELYPSELVTIGALFTLSASACGLKCAQFKPRLPAGMWRGSNRQ